MPRIYVSKILESVQNLVYLISVHLVLESHYWAEEMEKDQELFFEECRPQKKDWMRRLIKTVCRTGFSQGCEGLDLFEDPHSI